jgi:hypothetical protein
VRSSSYPSSEFSLNFLNIGSDNSFADDERGGWSATKPLVAMTAHASRLPAPQTVTTPPTAIYSRPSLRPARVSAANVGTEREGQGTHR